MHIKHFTDSILIFRLNIFPANSINIIILDHLIILEISYFSLEVES